MAENRRLLGELKKTVAAALGLMICACGSYLQLQAGIGLSPWNALNQGVASFFGITYGTAAAAISATVLLFDLLLREGIGIGSVLDTILVGRGVDVLARWSIVPTPSALLPQVALLLTGLTISAIGVKVYMQAGLCCGPRDMLMVALAKRLRNVPVGAVNCIIFAAVLAAAIWMGCDIGMGTVIATFANGPILEMVFRLTDFDPRKVEHESIFQTIRRCLPAAARR